MKPCSSSVTLRVDMRYSRAGSAACQVACCVIWKSSVTPATLLASERGGWDPVRVAGCCQSSDLGVGMRRYAYVAQALGLVPDRRQMMVGVPLLMALTPAHLDAVLAHELGHYGNRDTQVGGLVGRTRQGVLSALRTAGREGRFELPGAGLFVALFSGYAKVVLRVTQEASRAQEFAADRVAAEIAGPANVIAALSELRGIGAA